jgi:hypothetical protein
MRLRCLVVVLAFLTAFVSDSRGQSREAPQPSTEQKVIETAPSQPKPDSQNSKIEPAADSVPSPSAGHGDDRTATEHTQGGKQSTEGTEYWDYRGYRVKITDGLLALFTLGLVVIGIFQALFLKGTLKATAIAAGAAKTAADTVPTLERAYVFVEPRIQLPGNLKAFKDTNVAAREIRVNYVISNHGKTPAIIQWIEARFEFRSDPPDNSKIIPSKFMGDEFVIKSDGTHNESEFFEEILTAEMKKGLFEGEVYFWFYGSIQYEDIFGTTRYTRFRWRYNSAFEVFSTHGAAPYNERT